MTKLTIQPVGVPGRKFFHAKDKNNVKYENKFKGKAKFSLDENALDEKGNISELYFAESVVGFRRLRGKISKEVAQESGKAVMDGAWKMLLAIGRKGVQ